MHTYVLWHNEHNIDHTQSEASFHEYSKLKQGKWQIQNPQHPRSLKPQKDKSLNTLQIMMIWLEELE